MKILKLAGLLVAILAVMTACTLLQPLEIRLEAGALLKATGSCTGFVTFQIRCNIPGCPYMLTREELANFSFVPTGPLPSCWYLVLVPVLQAGERYLELAPWGCISPGESGSGNVLQLVPDLPGGVAAEILALTSDTGASVFFDAPRARAVLADRGLDGVSVDFFRALRDLESGSFSSWSLASREDCTEQVLEEDPLFKGLDPWKDAAGRCIRLQGADPGAAPGLEAGHLWEGLNTLYRLDPDTALLQVLLVDISKGGDGRWKSCGRRMECLPLGGEATLQNEKSGPVRPAR